MEATNSPITAPTGARRDGELDAGQMLGSALGNWIFCRHLQAASPPMARTIRSCSGSADFSPVTVFTITGKKVKATTKNISLLQAEAEPDQEQRRDHHLGDGVRDHQPGVEEAIDEARAGDGRAGHQAERHRR